MDEELLLQCELFTIKRQYAYRIADFIKQIGFIAIFIKDQMPGTGTGRKF